MNNTFSQLPKAQKEIIDAWEWYEEKQSGLGDQFKNEVAKKIRTVVENPLHYPVKGKYREAQTDVFPFLIVFKFDKKANMIVIVSVFHTSRHPKRKH
jgi:plasmid stabilization system protein ParE